MATSIKISITPWLVENWGLLNVLFKLNYRIESDTNTDIGFLGFLGLKYDSENINTRPLYIMNKGYLSVNLAVPRMMQQLSRSDLDYQILDSETILLGDVSLYVTLDTKPEAEELLVQLRNLMRSNLKFRARKELTAKDFLKPAFISFENGDVSFGAITDREEIFCLSQLGLFADPSGCVAKIDYPSFEQSPEGMIEDTFSIVSQ